MCLNHQRKRYLEHFGVESVGKMEGRIDLEQDGSEGGRGME